MLSDVEDGCCGVVLLLLLLLITGGRVVAVVDVTSLYTEITQIGAQLIVRPRRRFFTVRRC